MEILLVIVALAMTAGAYFICRSSWILVQHSMWLRLCKEYYHDWACEHPDEPLPKFRQYLDRGMLAFGEFNYILYDKPLCWDFLLLADDQEIIGIITSYIYNKRKEEAHKTKDNV